MKNIPVFTACGGTATLILKEIPALGRAYAILQTHTPGQEPEQAAACIQFCRMAGAREVYLSCRDGTTLPYAHSHDMLALTLSRPALTLPERHVHLIPVDASLAPFYIEHYNRRFAPVLGAALYDTHTLARAAADGCRHYAAASRDGQWVGLGAVRESTLEAVASLQPGWGADVARALLAETTADPISLLVCSANTPAMNLYQRLGFVQTELVSRWYVGSL